MAVGRSVHAVMSAYLWLDGQLKKKKSLKSKKSLSGLNIYSTK